MAGQRTQPGTIMGTLSYMSPEQARGLPVDRRTDIWALRMCALRDADGRAGILRRTTSDIVAKILERDPDWASLPAATPDAVHRVLRWALVKDAQRRLRHVGDASLELETSASSASRRETEPARRRWPMVAALVAAAILGAIIGAAVRTPLAYLRRRTPLRSGGQLHDSCRGVRGVAAECGHFA